MKRVLVTFADSRLRRSLERIKSEAESIGAFDQIYTLTENDLELMFRKKFEKRLRPDVRGFGYWCWKPQAIIQVLTNLEYGDLLLYLDVGCHLNARGLNRLNDYFHMAENGESGMLAFQTVAPVSPLQHDGRHLLDLTEKLWTKGDVLDYFSVRNNPEVSDTQQFGSGVIFFRKCKKSEDFLADWMSVMAHSFSMLDDSPSVSENAHGFIEHRHDQSLFSILCKIKKVDKVSSYEYWYPQKNSMKPDWDALKLMPIHASRMRDYGAITNVKKFIENKIDGLRRRFRSYCEQRKNTK